MIDKFRVNWTENVTDNSIKKVMTSITGYSYQIEDWYRSYLTKYSIRDFDTKKISSISNSDGTQTVIYSRTEKPKERAF